jgi:hypothetical protein
LPVRLGDGVEGEVGEDRLEVGGIEAPRVRDAGVDLGTERVPLVRGERADLDPGGGGEVGEALVGAREPGGGGRDCVVGLVVERRDPQPLEDEEVEVRLDETARLPVEGDEDDLGVVCWMLVLPATSPASVSA